MRSIVGGGATRSIVRGAVPIVAAVALVWATSCGDSSPPQGAEAPEIQVLTQGQGAEFLPFDEPPVLKSFQAPQYPAQAREKGLEGAVMVKVRVGVDGAVEETSVLHSTEAVFEAAALEAAARCRFAPAKRGGQPTPSLVAVPFEFKMND